MEDNTEDSRYKTSQYYEEKRGEKDEKTIPTPLIQVTFFQPL